VIRRIWLGLGGALIAGALIGIAEALFVLWGGAVAEYQALVYAAVLYGLIGGGVGVGAGLGLAALGAITKKLSEPVAWTLGFLSVYFPLGLVIARYIVNKAVYAEAGVPGSAMGVIGVAFLVSGALILWLGAVFLSRTPMKILLEPRGTFAAWGGLVGLAALFSFAPSPKGGGGALPARPASAAPAGSPDIILIVVDTFRADHVGAYGNTQGLTPAIDGLAADGLVFEQYVTQASWTRASFASLYSSMPPSGHKSKLKAEALPDAVDTMAEVLSAGHYATGGLPNNINVTRSFNFQQGFDVFEYQRPSYIAGAEESSAQLSMYNVLRKVRDRLTKGKYQVTDYYQPAEVVLENARGFVKANRDAGNRYMLVVHLMEPHDPYFRHPYDGYAVGRAWHPNPDPSEATELRELYAGEIKYMDKELGAFFAWLKAEGAYDQAAIVLTADHGEEFNEHGGWWHGITLYEEQVHVPLIMKLPAGELSGMRVPWQVREIDVAPTFAHLAKAQASPMWQGRNLLDAGDLDLIRRWNAPPAAPAPAEPSAPEAAPGEPGAAPATDAVVAAPVVPAPARPDAMEGERTAIAEQDFEGNVINSLRVKGCKYITANAGNPRGLPETALFYLPEDPGEQKNLIGSSHSKCEPQALDLVLQNEIKAAGGSGVKGATIEISCEECQNLMQLGYMSDCSASCP
jgi:arylsulfatase A-like enzyme